MYRAVGQVQGSFPRVDSPRKMRTWDLGAEEQQVRDASVGVIIGVGLLVFFIGYVALADRAR